MAKAKLTTDIPGIGLVTVEGNVATEDAIQELISIFKSQEQRNKINTDSINDNLDDAADNLDEFSDELIRAEKNQSLLNERMKDLAESASNGIQGMQRFADSGGSLSAIVESFGGIAESLGRGIGSFVPFFGDGLAELGGAAAQAVVGLTSMAVGTIEGFVGLNKSIFNAGLQIEGGFGAFGELAQDASLPINEFANAVIQSRDRLRLFSGGAPGGIQNVTRALAQFRDDRIMENLYSLGFTTEEIVAGMSDYAIAAQRAGRDLSTEELAEGSNRYLRNLRELSRITGVSIQEQQAKLDADRANLFIQNALLDVAPDQRAAAELFASTIPDALAPIRDFIITGQSFTAESGLMANEMSTFAGIYRQAYEAVASGTMSQEEAQAYLASAMEANADQIEAEAERTTRAFGVAPSSIIQEGEALGAAIRAAREMVQAGAATDEAGGTEVETGSFQDALGTFEQTINEVQEEIQSVFFDTADGLAPMVTNLADMIGETVNTMGDYRELLQDAMQGDTETLQRRFEEMFGTELTIEPGASAMEALTNAISDAIYNGFTRVLADSWWGRRFTGGGRTGEADPDPFEGAIPPAANGEILSGPTSGYLAELHGTEAVVPLPDGRSIPVNLTTASMQGMLNSAIAIQEEAVSNNAEQTTQSFATSLDNTKSLPELVNISRNMLGQMITSTQRLEQMIRAIEESNSISRNTGYARA